MALLFHTFELAGSNSSALSYLSTASAHAPAICPDWWTSYNHIKHNFNKSFKEATLKTAIILEIGTLLSPEQIEKTYLNGSIQIPEL